MTVPKIIRRFIEMESSGGIVMILSAVVAMLVANSAFYPEYKSFINTSLTIGFANSSATGTLKEWVKDVLMVFFFFLIGLELKREMVQGFLSKKEQVILPLFAALGGMIMPAIIFLAINHNHPENLSGWAIPSATDIAFALCILMLVARKIPPSVKIFLLAIAIFDDLGAILVIAFFYSSSLNFAALALVFLGIGVLYILNRFNISLIFLYIITGIYLWFCLHYSGIHTTVAGVLVGLFVPMKSVNKSIDFLHGWVSFLILPIFAFTSAGVNLKGFEISQLLQPLPVGIAMALFFGKQIGIFGTTWILVRSKIVNLPENSSWMHIYGVSVIAGIGFTMSLFIGALAFSDNMQMQVKIGVISGSLLSTLWGAIILYANQKSRADKVI